MKTKIKNALKSPYFYVFMLFPLGILLLAAAKYVPGFAQWYYENIYYYLGGLYGSISGLFPFSLMEAAICAGIFLLVYWFIKAVLKRKEGSKAVLKHLCAVLMRVLSVASAVFFLFSVFCGTNYHRESFSEYIGLEVKASSVDELYDLCEFLILETEKYGENLLHDENGTTVFAPSDFIMANTARTEFEKFAENHGLEKMGFFRFGTPKPVFFSEVMAYLKISGVFSPYTFEANINSAGPDFLRGSTMMHEQSHLYGFMNEAESNFIAYLASVESENDYFRYSGTCLALLYSMNALYSADYERWYELRIRYPEYVSADMAAQNAYVAAHETKVAEVSDAVNDTYLKLNDQKDGVRSYGKMVDLLLAYRRTV